MELNAIRVRVRDLEGEKAAIEKEVGVVKKKKASLEGVELSLDDWNMESIEESMVDQLMIENKLLECEKMSALKEVEVWKQKCKELELRVVELEGKLSSQCRDGVLSGVNSPSRFQGANAKDVELQMGGITCIKTPEKPHLEDSETEIVQRAERAKRQLVFRNGRTNDKKIAPSTPGGPITIIESDDEDNGPGKHRLSFHGRGTPSVTKSVHADEIVSIMDLDDATDSKDSIFFVATPKRKRGPKVVCSDDECEDDEIIPTKRACKINEAENESDEDDDSLPVGQAFNTVHGNSQSDDDENDDIPISQRFLNRAQHSSQPIAKRTRSCSGRQSVNVTQRQSRQRRRLVKSQQGEEISGRAEETENSPEMTTENVEDSDLAEDDSDSEADSLKGFIADDDSDVQDVQDNVAEDGTDHSTEVEDSSDSNLGFRDIISRLQRRKSPNSKWALEGEMLSDFGKDLKLCMKAVCALYRQQTADEKLCKDSIRKNGRGFSKFDASRGTKLGEFLTGGDPNGNLVKTVSQLRVYDPVGVEVCRRLAKHYSKQLFEIYKNNEDPFFP